jgi:hypothetical protein
MLRRMTFVQTVQRAYQSTVLDGILLEKAERIAGGYPASGQQKLRELFEVGNRRANAATDLLESQPVAAAVLYRDAAIGYIGAILAGRGETVEFGVGDGQRAFERLDAVRSDLRDPPPEFERARGLLTSDDPLAIDRMPENEASSAVQGIANTVTWLRDSIEPRTVTQIRRSRIARLVVLGVCALALLIWAGMSLFSPTNIALHKHVTTSSVHAQSTAPEGGLTDGNTSGAYGVHTAVEQNPWVKIDLAATYELKKIKVYNRGDGWFDESLPLTLELSENGTDFQVVDHRTTSFSQWSPWVYAANGKKARYILVRGAPGKFVALSEIEAFGKK